MPAYRCSDCFSGLLVCKECCVESHQLQPFHRVKVRALPRYSDNLSDLLAEVERLLF